MPTKRAEARARQESTRRYLYELRGSVTDIEMAWPDYYTPDLLTELSTRLLESRMVAIQCIPSIKIISDSVSKIQRVLKHITDDNESNHQHSSSLKAVQWQWQDQAVPNRLDQYDIKSWTAFVYSWIAQCLAISYDGDDIARKVEDTITKHNAFDAALSTFWEISDVDIGRIQCDAITDDDVRLCETPIVSSHRKSATSQEDCSLQTLPLTNVQHEDHVRSKSTQSDSSPTNSTTLSLPSSIMVTNFTPTVHVHDEDAGELLVPSLGLHQWAKQYKWKQEALSGASRHL